MPNLQERIQEDQTLADNQDLASAYHNSQWADTFSSIPPADKLRERVNLADTFDRVAKNKIALQALTDEKALKLMDRTARFEEYQRQAPLREELLLRKVASEGAHEKFMQQKDAQTMGDVTGFFDKVGKITASPGTPEYKAALNAAVQAHPRVIGTQVGQDALKNLNREHDDVATIVANTPAGQEIDRIHVGDDGKTSVTFKPVTSEPVIPSGLVPTGATVANGKVTARYGTQKDVKDPEVTAMEKQLGLHQSTLDRASSRRIQAQKALDAARKTKDETVINNNLDLVKAADEDIIAAKAALKDVGSQLDARRNPSPATGAAPHDVAAVSDPAVDAYASSEPPVLTDKSQFDALPSGSIYIRNGRQFRKP